MAEKIETVTIRGRVSKITPIGENMVLKEEELYCPQMILRSQVAKKRVVNMMDDIVSDDHKRLKTDSANP